MSYFLIGFIILSILTVIFYIASFLIFRYWHERKETYLVIPVMYTFEFFVVGFLIISIISIILSYLPDIIQLTS